MRVAIPAKLLAEAIKVASRGVLKRTTIPVLQCFLVEVQPDGTTFVSATTLDLAITATIAGGTQADAGSVLVPAQWLAGLVNRIAGDVPVTLRTEEDSLLATANRGRWRRKTLSVADWPKLNSPGKAAVPFSLTGTELQRLARWVTHAISTEEARYYLTGALLHQSPSGAALVATDGHRLALARLPSGLDLGDLQAIIARDVLAALGEIIRRGDDVINIRVDHDKIEAGSGNFLLCSKLIDARFPDYEKVLPQVAKHGFEVGSADLLAATTRHAAAAENEKLPTIGLSWGHDGDTLRTCLSSNETDSVEEISASAVHGVGRVAVRASQLVDLIEALKTKTIRITHGGPSEPVRFESEDAPGDVMILMPVTWWGAAAVDDDRPTPPDPIPLRTARGK